MRSFAYAQDDIFEALVRTLSRHALIDSVVLFPHLPPTLRSGAAGNPLLLLSHWERRTRSASEGKGVGGEEEDPDAPGVRSIRYYGNVADSGTSPFMRERVTCLALSCVRLLVPERVEVKPIVRRKARVML